MTTDTEKPTYNEAVENLTGFDEIAIEKKFGTDLDELRISMQLRALIFIARTRTGLTEKDAYNAAMNLTVKQLDDEFSDAPDDDVPAAPGAPLPPVGEGADSVD